MSAQPNQTGQWTLEINGQRFGPYTRSQIDTFLEENRIAADTRITGPELGNRWITVAEMKQQHTGEVHLPPRPVLLDTGAPAGPPTSSPSRPKEDELAVAYDLLEIYETARVRPGHSHSPAGQNALPPPTPQAKPDLTLPLLTLGACTAGVLTVVTALHFMVKGTQPSHFEERSTAATSSTTQPAASSPASSSQAQTSRAAMAQPTVSAAVAARSQTQHQEAPRQEAPRAAPAPVAPAIAISRISRNPATSAGNPPPPAEPARNVGRDSRVAADSSRDRDDRDSAEAENERERSQDPPQEGEYPATEGASQGPNPNNAEADTYMSSDPSREAAARRAPAGEARAADEEGTGEPRPEEDQVGNPPNSSP